MSAFTTSKGIVSEIAVSRRRTIPRNNSNTAFLIDAATPDFYTSSSNTDSPDDSLGNTDCGVPDREAFTTPRFSPDTFIVRKNRSWHKRKILCRYSGGFLKKRLVY